MTLPNFINFEPFNALRRKMHAERLGRFGDPLPPEASELGLAEVADAQQAAIAAPKAPAKKKSGPRKKAKK